MKRQVRILKGLHLGAEAPLEEGGRCVIGADPSCSVVLCDPGVAPKHFLLTADAYGITCRALDASLTIDGRQVPIGQAVNVADFQIVRCGEAMLSVGPLDSDWAELDRVMQSSDSRVPPVLSARAWRHFNPYVLFAGVAAAVVLLLGLSYAALTEHSSELSPKRVEQAQRWLSSIAPADSELQIRVDNHQQMTLVGYVTSNYQRELLTAAANDSPYRPRVDVYVAEEMVISMLRLAKLENLPCVPVYKGSGKVACTNDVQTDVIADRLKAIAQQIPGLAVLDVRVDPNAISAASVMAAMSPAERKDKTAAPAAPTKLSKKFSVVIFNKRRYLVGEFGDKYKEGDDFNGFTIMQIGVDEVIFKRDGREYAFYVAALGGA